MLVYFRNPEQTGHKVSVHIILNRKEERSQLIERTGEGSTDMDSTALAFDNRKEQPKHGPLEEHFEKKKTEL